jgi:hypothetical protein
MWLISSML